MSAPELLLVLACGVPLLLAAASIVLPQPRRLLPWGAVPGLACALLAPGSDVEFPEALLGAALAVDHSGAVFLGFCAALWLAAGAYAQAHVAGGPRERSFSIFWQLTLAGSLGVFLAADVITFYVAFACVSLPAYVLVVHERSPEALRAGRIYIAMAVAGEMALLVGLLLGAQAAGGILVADVRAALAASPQGPVALACLVAGLGLKAGLLPLHGWLPLAHAAAPAPASAVLSGAMVKAGVIGLLRFFPAEGALPQLATGLAWLGMATAWAGVLLGVVQRQPKPVLAYSTMSQMGLLLAVVGAGSAAAGLGAATQDAATLFALHHGLAKGALFLAAGLLAAGARGRAPVLLVAALLGAAIAGLPLSGGALAKLAIKAPLGGGALGHLATASAVGTMLLMLRFLWLQAHAPAHGQERHASALQWGAFAALAAAALLAPWLLAPRLAPEALAHAAQAAALGSGLWPLLVAIAVAAVAWRWGPGVPKVPAGDLAAWTEAGWQAWRGAPRTTPPRWRPRFRLTQRIGPWARHPLSWARLAAFPAGAVALAAVALLLGWTLVAA